MEKIEVYGNVPQPRFGHSIALVSKTKAVLFGGATGDTGRYQITGDTYSYDLITRTWKKIEGTPASLSSHYLAGGGSSPSPRAAHSSVAVESNQLVVYGGATGGNKSQMFQIE